MVLTALSALARLGALAASIIAVGLGASFIQNVAWNKEFLIYVEAIAATSILAAFIPPYPNFLYNLVAGLAWILMAIFMLVVQVHILPSKLWLLARESFWESASSSNQTEGRDCFCFSRGAGMASICFLCMFVE